MDCAPDLVVLCVDRTEGWDGRAALADAIVVTGHRCHAGSVLADLFKRYPGLAVAAVVDEPAGLVVAATRTGTVLIERLPG